jgi:CheY-like chemotaxis protein
MRVLIVDDNASMRAMLSALLGSNGYEVVGALPDGSEIMATIQQTSPDIVCLDYQLPGRDGLDILREINETVSQIDVVFMTASEDASVEGKAADDGAAGFLRKPFTQSQIISELRQVGDTRRQARSSGGKPGPLPGDGPAPVAAVSRSEDDAAAGANPASGGAPSEVVFGPFNPRSVVIADDNGSIRYLLKGLLNGLGLQVVHQVSNGAEAIAAAKAHRPGILCLDVNMPVMSGLEALPLIKEASPRTAVVMVTGSASREFVEKAAALGAKGYIVKPIRPAYVEAFIRKLLK